MRTTAVRLLALTTLFAAACDGDGSGSSRLFPDDVDGVYAICKLRFVPDQSVLPTADLLRTVMDTTPPSIRPRPSIAFDPRDASYDLIYTRRGDAELRQLRGSSELRSSSVTPRFFSGDTPPSIPSELLLPAQLRMEFQESPRKMTVTSTLSYNVRRADYARAAGISENSLQERISGRMEAVFQENACP
jgi:hypothetical protein